MRSFIIDTDGIYGKPCFDIVQHDEKGNYIALYRFSNSGDWKRIQNKLNQLSAENERLKCKIESLKMLG